MRESIYSILNEIELKNILPFKDNGRNTSRSIIRVNIISIKQYMLRLFLFIKSKSHYHRVMSSMFPISTQQTEQIPLVPAARRKFDRKF